MFNLFELFSSSKKNKPSKELSYSTLPIFNRGLNGYLNYGIYSVSGKNPTTGRINTIQKIYAKNDDDAIAQAIAKKGLVEPFECKLSEFFSPSEKQYNYAKSLSLTIPDNISNNDISDMISRITNNDLNSPHSSLIMYADELNFHMSRYVGEIQLISDFIVSENLDTKIFGYIYYVCNYIKSWRYRDISIPNTKDKFDVFVSQNKSNSKFLNSLKRIYPCADDFSNYINIENYKDTNSYKIAKSFVEENFK